MRIFDAHCDTIFELREQKTELLKNTLHLDIERMSEYDTYIQVFAAFIDKKKIRRSPMNECLSLIRKYRAELEKNKDRIIPILSADDLNATDKGGVYSILSIEGGEALEGDLSALSMYYNLGVRLITLTWNYSNEIADGVCESRGGGLTEFGRLAVSEMERLGILIDVSHLSEAGFWDVASIAKKPFVASHSCAAALCPHIRNLTDKQISAIIKKNGCIGVNFYTEFLKESSCKVYDIYRHIEHILSLNGENCVGLGSDFDGVAELPYGMHGVENIEDLIELFYAEGMSDKQIAKITFENFYRVFHSVL